jgi:hypothetical protein
LGIKSGISIKLTKYKGNGIKNTSDKNSANDDKSTSIIIANKIFNKLMKHYNFFDDMD